jgi:hypothetical protein
MMDDTPKQSTYLCELLLILFLLQIVSVGLDLQSLHLSSLLKCHIQDQARLTWSLPISTIFPTWLEFSTQLSPLVFKRMFCMPLDAFESLCGKISTKVGEKTFCPDSYLCTHGMLDIPVYAAVHAMRAFIHGEICLAITLQLLAGGSYLDLGAIFWVSSSFIYKMFEECIGWVLDTFHFPLPVLLREGNWDQLKLTADKFTVKA